MLSKTDQSKFTLMTRESIITKIIMSRHVYDLKEEKFEVGA